jgi:hypothetical protein
MGPYLYDNDQPQVEIASGDQASIMNLWAAARASGDQINSLNLRYPPMGFIPPNSPSGSVLNSNSVASTLIRAMGLVEPSIPGSAFLTPGRGNILLDQNAINDIQSQHNIQSGPSDSPGSAVPPGAVPLPRPRPGAPPSSAPNSPGPLNILPARRSCSAASRRCRSRACSAALRAQVLPGLRPSRNRRMMTRRIDAPAVGRRLTRPCKSVYSVN